MLSGNNHSIFKDLNGISINSAQQQAVIKYKNTDLEWTVRETLAICEKAHLLTLTNIADICEQIETARKINPEINIPHTLNQLRILSLLNKDALDKIFHCYNNNLELINKLDEAATELLRFIDIIFSYKSNDSDTNKYAVEDIVNSNEPEDIPFMLMRLQSEIEDKKILTEAITKLYLQLPDKNKIDTSMEAAIRRTLLENIQTILSQIEIPNTPKSSPK